MFHEQYTDGSSDEGDSFAILYRKSQYTVRRADTLRVYIYKHIKSWYSMYRKGRGVLVAVFAETEAPIPRAPESSGRVHTRRRGDIVEKWRERTIGPRVTLWVIHEPTRCPCSLARPFFSRLPRMVATDRPKVHRRPFCPFLCARCRINIRFLPVVPVRNDCFFFIAPTVRPRDLEQCT